MCICVKYQDKSCGIMKVNTVKWEKWCLKSFALYFSNYTDTFYRPRLFPSREKTVVCKAYVNIVMCNVFRHLQASDFVWRQKKWIWMKFKNRWQRIFQLHIRHTHEPLPFNKRDKFVFAIVFIIDNILCVGIGIILIQLYQGRQVQYFNIYKAIYFRMLYVCTQAYGCMLIFALGCAVCIEHLLSC